jgi:hypothetical protein
MFGVPSPPQLSKPVHVPQLTFRFAPQLSVVDTVPHWAARREQMA